MDAKSGNKQTNVNNAREINHSNVENETIERQDKESFTAGKISENEREILEKGVTENGKKVKDPVIEIQNERNQEESGKIINETNKSDIVNQEKVNVKKRSKIESKDVNEARIKLVKLDSRKIVELDKNLRDTKDIDVTDNVEPDQKKALPNDKFRTSKKQPTIMNKETDFVAESEDSSSRNSVESVESQTSKKSSRVFANSINPGLLEKGDTKKPRRQKKVTDDIGLINQGNDKEEEVQKVTDNKNVVKEGRGNPDKEQEPVRESPSLEPKTGMETNMKSHLLNY